MMVYSVCLFIFWVAMTSFFISQKHVLMMLMLLEFVSITVLFMLVNFLVNFLFDSTIIIYFIIVMVCEAVMGLVLLTLMVRTHGVDYFKVLSIFLC
uniref:NADH-ubiquinone oxidoreductase chain 4L n=1 Tax=Russelliana solanicola TaxID=2008469 RepID=A0A344A2R9_9HEMI|nr:NADH dehydrogenase subunit 4L [Russelliana solanicola]AWU49060.1 NADH dehydrogenase subunit 4L [Russelliana solanicola]